MKIGTNTCQACQLRVVGTRLKESPLVALIPIQHNGISDLRVVAITICSSSVNLAIIFQSQVPLITQYDLLVALVLGRLWIFTKNLVDSPMSIALTTLLMLRGLACTRLAVPI